MFSTGKELLSLAQKQHCRLCDIILKQECSLSEMTREDVYLKLKQYLSVMKQSTQAARTQPVVTRGGLISGDAKKLSDYALKGRTVCGATLVDAMSRALSSSEVNASMGKICAAPTAGANGIIPAALLGTADAQNLSEQVLLDGLLTASGIGVIIESNASLSGAYGGCQAECGSASAMAAAAIVEMLGGTPKAALHAAAIALKNIMGLVCDPVAGLVESPCAKRNASGTANAMLSADLALAGIESVIPFDEVVTAMAKVGRMMPYQLRETSLGGIAATPTALSYARKIYGNPKV